MYLSDLQFNLHWPTATSLSQPHFSLAMDSPYIDSCLNLSTTVCWEEVQQHFISLIGDIISLIFSPLHSMVE